MNFLFLLQQHNFYRPSSCWNDSTPTCLNDTILYWTPGFCISGHVSSEVVWVGFKLFP